MSLVLLQIPSCYRGACWGESSPGIKAIKNVKCLETVMIVTDTIEIKIDWLCLVCLSLSTFMLGRIGSHLTAIGLSTHLKILFGQPHQESWAHQCLCVHLCVYMRWSVVLGVCWEECCLFGGRVIHCSWQWNSTPQASKSPSCAFKIRGQIKMLVDRGVGYY